MAPEHRAAIGRNRRDCVVFQHGTCGLVPNGLAEKEAEAAAKDILSKIFHYHPDMNPVAMKDGNITVQYNHPALNVVLETFMDAQQPVVERIVRAAV